MASPLQNRIVGTAILVALAVIFLPDLLDGEKRSRDEALETIPLRPALTVEQSAVEFPDDFEERVDQAQPRPVQEDEFSSPPEPVSVTIGQNADDNADDNANDSGGENTDMPAWVVRLGAFRNTDNVERLVNQLQGEGYNAFSRTVRGNNGELQVLMVGPDFDPERLRGQLAELNALTGLEGQLVPYQPTPE